MLQQFIKVGLRIQYRNGFLKRQISPFKGNRNASSKKIDLDDDDMDQPIKYSTSEASKWRAAKSRNPLIDRHPMEGYIVSLSVAIFLLYFCILREENDWDDYFGQELKNYINVEQDEQPKPYNK